jgi:hypothetical protein
MPKQSGALQQRNIGRHLPPVAALGQFETDLLIIGKAGQPGPLYR